MGARILVIEDNAENLALMEYLLRAFGHTVLTATDGVAGVDAAVRHEPDIVLMDLQMPKLDGFGALQQIKARPALRRIPVVAVTAFAMVGDRDRILAQGFDGYIAKPIVPETFINQVESFLGDKQRTAAGSTAPAAGLPEGDAAAEHRPARILVVDNSPVNLQLARSTLEPFGFEIIEAHGAEEALRLAREHHPDLILSDLHMPRASGQDLFRWMQADERLRAIPFVFISSTLLADNDRRDALALGASAFVCRPIEPDALVEAVTAHLPAPVRGLYRGDGSQSKKGRQERP